MGLTGGGYFCCVTLLYGSERGIFCMAPPGRLPWARVEVKYS